MRDIERWRITPQYLMDISDPVADVYRHIEDEILINIAKQFKGGTQERSASFDWQVRKLAMLGKLTKENAAIIAKYAGDGDGLTRVAIEQVLLRTLRGIEPELADAAKAGFLRDAPQTVDESVRRQVDMYAQQALDRQNMVNTAMLNSSLDHYRMIVSNTARYERQLAEAQESLNRRAGEVITGTSTYQQAVRKALKDMLRSGLTGFTDRAGRNWTPEAYVSMDIRTTAHNASVEAVFSRCDDYDLSLIEVSSHAGARPRCEPFQGRIYDRNNGSGYVEDLDGRRVRYDPWSSTSYGEAAGLFGINCGHQGYPFIPGFSKQTFKPVAQAENDRVYQESQKQRYLERSIRAAKREAAVMKAAGDEHAEKEAAQRVKARQAAMREFISETGRTRRRDREQVVGF